MSDVLTVTLADDVVREAVGLKGLLHSRQLFRIGN